MLFDYVLYQINEACLATGGSEYCFDEIQPLATMFTLVDAPEAFYVAVKHGVEGIGEILRRSIAAALSRYPNSERLNMVVFQIYIFVSFYILESHLRTELVYVFNFIFWSLILSTALETMISRLQQKVLSN